MDFSNATEKVCLPIIIGILTLAFPLLLQTISRIDEKYNTSILNKRFKKEWQYKCFNGALYISLGWVFYHFIVAGLFLWEGNCNKVWNCIMENSSSIILIIFTIALIIKFILLINRIMVYYDHSKLLAELKEKTKNFENEDNEDFNAFILVCNYNIEKNDEGDNALSKLYEDLKKYAKSRYEKKQAFSNAFYYAIKRLNQKLCEQQFSSNAQIKGNELLNVLLPSDFSPKDTIISEKTYAWLFSFLRTQLNYGKTDWVYEYWQNASEYRFLNEMDTDDEALLSSDLKIRNEYIEKQNKNTENMENFEEFHVLIAAMIMHKKEFKLLAKLLSFNKYIQHNYPLVPSCFSDICISSLKFTIFSEDNSDLYLNCNINEINNEIDLIKEQELINKYFALLLFRLNGVAIENTFCHNAWDEDELPNELEALYKWSVHLKMLKEQVEYWDNNREHEAFKILEVIPDNEIRNNPLEKLELLINRIEDAMQKEQINGELTRAPEFIEFTKKTFEKKVLYLNKFTRKDRGKICDAQELIGGVTKVFMNEDYMDIASLNAINPIRSLARDIVIHLQRQFSSHYVTGKKNTRKTNYHFYEENAFKAIDKLVGENKDAFVIISFGILLSNYINHHHIKIDGLSKENDITYIYHGIEIRNFEGQMDSDTRGNLVVIPRNQLPYLEARQPTEEELQACYLNESDKIDNELGLYAGITKAKDNKALRDELLKEYTINEDDVDMSCLSSVYYSYNVFWKKDTELAVIKVLYKSDKNEVESNLKDVKPLPLPKEEEK